MKRYLVHLILSLLGIVQFLASQDDTLRTIMLLQDQREAPLTELVPYLSNSNPLYRQRALLAIANRQDSTALTIVSALLTDPSSEVRRMAAFAIGQLHDEKAMPFLIDRAFREGENSVMEEIFQAIGQCGTKEDLEFIVSGKIAGAGVPPEYIALAIARFANRRIKDLASAEYVYKNLSGMKNIRWGLYALSRLNVNEINQKYKDDVLKYSKHSSPNARMWMASIMAGIDDENIVKQLVEMAKRDKDWRVRINALRSLRTKEDPGVMLHIENLVMDNNEHISLQAIELVGFFSAERNYQFDSVAFMRILRDEKKFSPRQRGEIAKVLAEKYHLSILPELLERYEESQGIFRSKLLEAFGNTRSTYIVPIIKASLEDANSMIVFAAINAYLSIVRENPALNKDFLQNSIPLFARKDAGISYAVALALQDSIFSSAQLQQYLPQLVAAYEQMRSIDDLEPMIELMNVFTKVNDETVISSIEKSLQDDDKTIREAAFRFLSSVTGKVYPPGERPVSAQSLVHNFSLLESYAGAMVITEKGSFVIDFNSEVAPFTVISFIELVQKGFYDRLIFHRVVSNFVIQGGDPLGNGSGGPGYSLRTEVHPDARYIEGSVGMASAGKDTEGSQFFVTHCPTPHLDGRYTLFGSTKDLTVIDKLMVGDSIRSITLIPR